METPFTYIYSKKNDGQPSPYSAEQMAVTNAFCKFHEQGGYEWETLTIKKLPCEETVRHYPSVCWHYEITIIPPKEEPKEPLWVVKLYDGFDNEWMNVSEPMAQAEAVKLAGDKNEARIGSGAGNRHGHYGEIDYYKAYPVS